MSSEIDTPDTRPIWFLDIDGVLNALSYAPPTGFKEGVATFPDGATFTIRWSPSVIEEIISMVHAGYVRVVWLTTWGSEANTIFAPLVGLPEFEVAAEPPHDGGEEFGAKWWKLKAAQEWYADHLMHKFVWTDDDLAIEAEATSWARPKNIFVVHPNPYRGLLENDFNHIRSFVRGYDQG